MGQMIWRVGPSVVLASSVSLGWQGVAVEQHSIEAGEKPESVTSQFIIELASGAEPTYGERIAKRGRMMRYFKAPGLINIYADGVLPFIIPSVQTELIAVALDRDLVTQVAEETRRGANKTPSGRLGLIDHAAENLMRLMALEAQAGGSSGLLYADHLKHALVLRLLSLEGSEISEISSKHSLSQTHLRRVLDRMEADLAKDLDLESLAVETGYSRNHFLRLFSSATGSTPYQYLLRLRIKKAQMMIRQNPETLLDVAIACGFSSHTHLSRVFRQCLSMTPSEFRRSIR
jgi:AraC family transcriptional regulator